MTESVFQIRNRITPRIPARARIVTAPKVEPAVQALTASPVLVIEDPSSGHVIVSTPMHERADIGASDFLMNLSGRLVEAERANRNGAFWTQGDLEFGLPSVAYGPLNWLHNERKIIGALRDPQLITTEHAAFDPAIGPHIQTDAVMWKWVYPQEAVTLAGYIGDRSAWLSMECISQEIACVGPNGCGKVMPYMDAFGRTGAACSHVKERSSYRRFVNPIFQGAAVIVPPSSPGWANANLALQRQAAHEVERSGLEVEGLKQSDIEVMATQILQWSRGK